MIKTLITGLLLSILLSGCSHQVTSAQLQSCMKNQEIEYIGQIMDFKAQGVTNEDLTKALNENLPKEQREQLLKLQDFVYNQKHEINPAVTSVVNCLNK